MMQSTRFDKKAEYAERVAPLIEQVEAACKELGIPFFFTVATANSDQDTEYVTECRSALPMSIALADDKIVDHLKVCSGYHVMLPDNVPEIDI